MNKTININLGGFFFHIDEVAFQKLKRYLDAIAKSLSDDPQGKNEIIADIEARISEILSEKITDARQVINENDIDEVIKIMGQPEDYAEAEEGYANEDFSYQGKKSSGRKLFRDAENKMLGGVSAGLGRYFNVDTAWIRLAFLVLAGSGGFGIPIYVIMWIVVPEAKTTAEKLQMEGEDVNIDNIEKKIREEFHTVSEKIKTSAEEVSEKIKDGAKRVNESFKKKEKKGNSGLQDFLDTLGAILVTLFKIVGKFIGVILMIAAAITIISLIIGAFSIGSLDFLGFGDDFFTVSNFFNDSLIPTWLLTICIFLVFIIPVVALFILGLRIVSSNVKQFSKATTLTLFAIWLIALFGLIFTGIEFGTSKAFDGYHTEKQLINEIPKDTLKIKMQKTDRFFYNHNFYINSREIVTVNDTKSVYSNSVRIDVEKSDTHTTYMQIRKHSEGRNRSNANRSASEISYNFKLNENELLLDNYFLSDIKNLIKDESVTLTIFIPKGITVYFDANTRNYLYNINNTTDTYDRNMINHYFKMTDKGLYSKELQDIEDSNN